MPPEREDPPASGLECGHLAAEALAVARIFGSQYWLLRTDVRGPSPHAGSSQPCHQQPFHSTTHFARVKTTSGRITRGYRSTRRGNQTRNRRPRACSNDRSASSGFVSRRRLARMFAEPSDGPGTVVGTMQSGYAATASDPRTPLDSRVNAVACRLVARRKAIVVVPAPPVSPHTPAAGPAKARPWANASSKRMWASGDSRRRSTDQCLSASV